MSVLYSCAHCRAAQPTATSALDVYRTGSGRPLAHCACPDCGTRQLVLVSERTASEITWWIANDRVEIARGRAYARAAGVDPDRLSEACAEVVAGCERMLGKVN